MILGRVCGTIHSTINHNFYENRRLLVIDKLGLDGKPTGDYVIAVDWVDSGAGETVLVIDEGNSARQVVDDPMGPIRSIIVGVIDGVETE